MSGKEKVGHERVMLLHKCTEMNLSENRVLMISQFIKNSHNKDEKAKKIRGIIERMEYLKKLQSKKWENRLKLMELLTKMKASRSIHSKIENLLKNSQNKEKTAEDLISILKTTKTEQEIVEKIDSL